MLLATTAAKDGEMRNFDAEQEFLKPDIGEEVYIEIPGEYPDFPGAVGLLKAVYWLVQVRRCQNIKFCNDSMAIGFEQSKSDLRVFCKVADEEVEIVVVVQVGDILAHAKDQATMETFAAELGRKFKLKDMHLKPQSARIEVRPTLVSEVGDGDVWRPEGKHGINVVGGNPLKSG